MKIELQILNSEYLDDYKKNLKVSPYTLLQRLKSENLPVDYFNFYNSVSTVYSSKIEGENIDYDSYFKYKFLNIKYKPDYTKKADDLYAAYEFLGKSKLNVDNLLKVHSILSNNLLPKSQRGFIRNNPMFVLNNNDKIEYVAAPPSIVKLEFHKLFEDIENLLLEKLDYYEIFYFASYIHLVFVKIHPFQDGNGRSARLLEKWFLKEHIGRKAYSISLEKNYYKNLKDYYNNIKRLGIEYEKLDYSKCLEFLLMTAKGMNNMIDE